MSVDWGGYVFILLFLNKNRVFCLNIRKVGSNPYKRRIAQMTWSIGLFGEP